MPTAVLENPALVTPPLFRRKVWTRAECEALESLEVFQGQNLELIEGELIDRMGKGILHCVVVAMLQELFAGIFGLSYLMPEGVIDVRPEDNPTSEPQPDLTLLLRKTSSYAKRRPGPADIRLLAEVADSTLAFDLSIKARLYARAGIAEYWVADTQRRQIHVHRDPAGGVYQSVNVYSAAEFVTPLAAPQAQFRVSEAFPDSSG